MGHNYGHGCYNYVVHVQALKPLQGFPKIRTGGPRPERRQ